MGVRDPDELDLDAVRSSEVVDGDTRAGLAHLGEVARSLEPEDRHLDEPPSEVWSAVATQIGFAGRRDPGDEGAPDRSEGTDLPPGPGVPGVADLDSRRRGWWTARRGQIMTAAAGLVVVVALTAAAAVAVGGLGGGGSDTAPLATTRLEPLVDVAPAEARLVEQDGRVHLDVPLAYDDLPPAPGYYEVWLIDPAVEGMISLGPLRADGVYDVPDNVDPGAYPIVDVSREPDDGDPTHSGDSVLRGTLDI